MNRRGFLKVAGIPLLLPFLALAQPKKAKTKFQIACMTLPYSRFPFERALKGIKSAGYEFVALGTTHPVDGKTQTILKNDDGPERAKEIGQQCRDAGLEPVLMFSMIYPENAMGLEVLK